MERRKLLATAGTGILSGLAGCSWGSDQQTSPPDPGGTTTPKHPDPDSTDEPRFENVINLVEEGADDTGEEPIQDLIHEHIGDNTLLVLDEGRFALGQVIVDDHRNFGITAAEGATPTLVPAGTIEEVGEYWIVLHGEDVRFGGFEYDFTADRVCGRTQIIANMGGFEVSDIHVRGQVYQVTPFRFGVRDPNGVGRVQRVIDRDGARTGDRMSGLFVGVEHAGEIHFVDCEMWHFPSKGIYASNPGEDVPDAGGGKVHVEGGVFKNNNAAAIRIGSEGSTVRNVTVVVEDTLDGEDVTWEEPVPLLPPNGHSNIRGLRLKGGENVLVEGCTFDHELGSGDGVLTVEGSHGESTVRDCRIRSESADLSPVRMKPSPEPMTFESVSIIGTGGGAPAVRMVGREGTEFRDSSIEARGTGKNGVEMVRTDRCIFENTPIESAGSPIVLVESGREDPSPYSHRLIIERNGAPEPPEYALTVDGEITEASGIAEAIDDRTIAGVLRGDTLSITFVGQLSEFRPGDRTKVTVEYVDQRDTS